MRDEKVSAPEQASSIFGRFTQWIHGQKREIRRSFGVNHHLEDAKIFFSNWKAGNKYARSSRHKSPYFTRNIAVRKDVDETGQNTGGTDDDLIGDAVEYERQTPGEEGKDGLSRGNGELARRIPAGDSVEDTSGNSEESEGSREHEDQEVQVNRGTPDDTEEFNCPSTAIADGGLAEQGSDRPSGSAEEHSVSSPPYTPEALRRFLPTRSTKHQASERTHTFHAFPPSNTVTVLCKGEPVDRVPKLEDDPNFTWEADGIG